MNEQTVFIDEPSFPPPPPPPAAPPPAAGLRWYERPVSRDPDDHKVGGVISGLSRTYGFDVRTTRIAVLIATIVLPVLIVAYAAAWILLPARPAEAASLEQIVRDRRRIPLYLAIGLVLIAGGVGSFGSWFFLGGVPWGLGLIAVGVLLWAAPTLSRSSSPAPAGPPTASPSGPPTGAAPAGFTMPLPPPGDAMPVADAPTTVLPTTAGPTTAGPTPQSTPRPIGTTPMNPLFTGSRPLQLDAIRPPRTRRPVASLVTLAVLAFIGVAAAGDALDWWDIPVLVTVVVALIGTAVGAIVSAIVNRSWLALPVVPLLAVVTTGLLITQPNLDGGLGDRTLAPATVAAAERPQHLAAGELTMNLTAVPLGDDTVDVRATVGYGHLEVVVPSDATVELDAEMGAGDVVVDGRTVADGFRNGDQRTLQPSGASSGTIHLDVEVGAGRIDIRHA